MSDQERPMKAALDAVRLPATARAHWTLPPPAPAVGQIWRARWEQTAALVLLLNVTRSTVHVAVATTDVHLADDAALVLPAESTHCDAPLAIWDAIGRDVPTRTLDRYIDTLPTAVLNGGTRGRTVTTPVDRRVEERARIEDQLDALASAAWALPNGRDIRELLEQTGIQAQLLTLPGITPPEALRLARGQRPPTSQQAQALAELTGVPADTWLQANPQLPEALIEELDQPTIRHRIVALARTRGHGEVEEWRNTAHEVFALAARQTGQEKAPDWQQRLLRYLAGQGA